MPQDTAALPGPSTPPAATDLTDEWQYDPYTGQPIKR
jgi:hypothetical protein